jgi:hypothetical protein
VDTSVNLLLYTDKLFDLKTTQLIRSTAVTAKKTNRGQLTAYLQFLLSDIS